MYFAHNYSFLAFSAAMEGRKAETLAAVQSVAQTVPVDMLLAMGDSGWHLTRQHAALGRCGRWAGMMAVLAPGPRARGLTGRYRVTAGWPAAASRPLRVAR